MRTRKKEWVFNLLVKDPDNIKELIAYAIYKADKNEQANYLKNTKKTDEEINNGLDEFHNSIASSRRKQKEYAEKSEKILSTLINSMQKKLIDKHKKDMEKKQKEWCLSAIDYSKSSLKTPIYKRVLLWLLSGIPTLIATYLATILILGTIVLLNPNMSKWAQRIFISTTQNLATPVDISSRDTQTPLNKE